MPSEPCERCGVDVDFYSEKHKIEDCIEALKGRLDRMEEEFRKHERRPADEVHANRMLSNHGING